MMSQQDIERTDRMARTRHNTIMYSRRQGREHAKHNIYFPMVDFKEDIDYRGIRFDPKDY